MAKSKSIVGKIIAAVIVLCLIAAIIGAISWLTNGFKDSIKTFGVSIDDNVIVNNADELVFKKSAQFNIISPFSNEYSVAVFSRKVNNDFDLTVSGEAHTWNNNVASRDFTSAFTIDTYSDHFILNYETLERMIETVFAFNKNTVAIIGRVNGYPFEMRITSGMSTIVLGFTLDYLYAPIESIELDTGSIIV